MAFIEITEINLLPVQSVDRNVTIEYKLESDPDLPENWIYFKDVLVPPSGVLSPKETIRFLDDNTLYSIRVTADCGSEPYVENVRTPNYNLAVATVGDYVQAPAFFHNGIITSFTVQGQDMNGTIMYGSPGYPLYASMIPSDPLAPNYAASAYNSSDALLEVQVGVDVNGETSLYLEVLGIRQNTPVSGIYTFSNVPNSLPLNQSWYLVANLYKEDIATTTLPITTTVPVTTTTTTFIPSVSERAFITDSIFDFVFCDFQDFPDVLYRNPSVNNIYYTDSARTTLAPRAFVLRNDLKVVHIWNGTNILPGSIYIPDNDYVLDLSNNGSGQQDSVIVPVYIEPGQTVRFRVNRYEIIPNVSPNWFLRIETDGLPVESPATTSDSLVFDYTYTSCEKLQTSINEVSPISSTAYDATYDILIELL